MKIEFRDDNFIVFLNKRFSKKINFLDKIKLEDYFKKLFNKLKEVYNIDISGSYKIEVFRDDNYGVILSIKKDFDDYFDYYDDQVDMSIIMSKYDKFVYRLSGFLDSRIIRDCDVYFYNNDFYICPFKLSFINIGYLLENCEIIYGKDVCNIINNGAKIPNNVYVC